MNKDELVSKWLSFHNTMKNISNELEEALSKGEHPITLNEYYSLHYLNETEGNILVRAKALIPVFIPLVLSSIVNTEEKAITLEARGFSIGEKRTILDDIKETENDKKIKILLVIFLILCIIWRVYVLF